MWETRCFLPAHLGSVFTDATLRMALFQGAPPAIVDCLTSSVWDAVANTIPENRTDIYFCIPGPAGAFVGLKLRGGKKAEAKVVTNVSAQPQDSGNPVAAQWTKYQQKLKHGFRKKKKILKFLHDIDLPHAAAAAAAIAELDEESLGARQLVVQKSRRIVPLDAVGLTFEEACLRLYLAPSGGESDSSSDGGDLHGDAFSTPERQERRSKQPPSAPSSAATAPWSLVSWSVEGSSPALVEQVGLLWSRHVVPRLLRKAAQPSSPQADSPEIPTDATPYYGLLSYPEVCTSLWTVITHKADPGVQASRL